jgi:hypothetical protein
MRSACSANWLLAHVSALLVVAAANNTSRGELYLYYIYMEHRSAPLALKWTSGIGPKHSVAKICSSMEEDQLGPPRLLKRKRNTFARSLCMYREKNIPGFYFEKNVVQKYHFQTSSIFSLSTQLS